MKTQANKPSVLVMMATYNGECYVAEQIESILAQKDVTVTLHISDDGSTDSTCAICEGFACRFENVLFRQNATNKGLAKNFMDMVYGADPDVYDYFAFSDQDDFWLPEKLAKAVEAIERAGAGPRLYYSDVCNTDAELQGGENEYTSFAPYAQSLKLLLTVNWASGCTMVFNSEFASKLQEYEPKTWPRIHDGWVHLVALSCGWTVPDLEHAYIKRRISGQNEVGQRGLGAPTVGRLVKNVFNLRKGSTHFGTVSARELLNGYSGYMAPAAKGDIEEFVNGYSSLRTRIKLLCDKGYFGPYHKENQLYKIKMFLNVY